MILKILEDKENKLLDRKEILAGITFEGKTPSNIDVKKKLGEELKVNENVIVIDHIYQNFGLNKAKVHAKIYNSEENLNKIEKANKKKKKEEKKEPSLEESSLGKKLHQEKKEEIKKEIKMEVKK